MRYLIFFFVALQLNVLSAQITHENQFDESKLKVWDPKGNAPWGDYVALEGDHTGTASLHIRVYANEGGTLNIWFSVIEQNDLAVFPKQKVYESYVRTRTNGTWKDAKKVEYLRFVVLEDAKGVVFGGRFYKKTD
ncbi:MAG: hypothetical protein ACSHXL_05975 [Bacteroidota bacterium]